MYQLKRCHQCRYWQFGQAQRKDGRTEFICRDCQTPADRRVPDITDAADMTEYLFEHEPIGGWTIHEVFGALTSVGRNAEPALLAGLYFEGVLHCGHLEALLGGAWSGCEYPANALDRDEWLHLFALAGYTRTAADHSPVTEWMEGVEAGYSPTALGPPPPLQGWPYELGRRWPRPRKPVTLYRGAPASRRVGWSWTSDPDMAHKFANGLGYRDHGQVWVTTVAPELLLARIEDRSEAEYVIDPEALNPDEVRPLAV